MNTQSPHRSSEDKLYELAARQAGYFTTAQARQAGVSRRQLAYYAQTRLFERVRRGMYRLTWFPASPHEDLFVAWLEAGPQAVVSHESALALYDLSDILPAEIHLIIPRTASRRHDGIRLHTHQLAPEDVVWYSGLPVTSVPRTIADVASSGLAEELVIQAVGQAIQKGLATVESLLDIAECRGGRARRLIGQALPFQGPQGHEEPRP
jgi:predicted transcriptional regulator of viral defense system